METLLHLGCWHRRLIDESASLDSHSRKSDPALSAFGAHRASAVAPFRSEVVKAPLDSVEPPIDIMQKNIGGIWDH